MPRASSTPSRAPKGKPRLTLVKGGSGKPVRSVASRPAKAPARAAKATARAPKSTKPVARVERQAPHTAMLRAPLALVPKKATKTAAGVAAARAKAAAANAADPPVRVAREKLLERYTPLIKYVVERLSVGLPKNVDHDDLMSAGMLGLLDAYDKFDAGKGTKFETYAVWRIKGAVLDQLRALDWASRSIRRKAREVEASTRRLDQRLGRAATDEEVAREAKMPLGDYHRLMDQVRGAVLLSLDETRSPEDGDSLGLAEIIEDPNVPDVLARIEEEETRMVLLETLNNLPEQERIVVALYYYEHMTLREIGVTLGISESRVSQVHSRAVVRLKSRVRRALAA
jgi:RNA polymerase sigma factor for flagellar operon FliA